MNEMWRWVDPRVDFVHLADLQSYLLAHGWKLKPYPQAQAQLFEKPIEGSEEPIVQLLPTSEQIRDFRRSVIDAITSLSAVEERHPIEILNEILRPAMSDQFEGSNGPGAINQTMATANSGGRPSLP
jgi:hypothetical protein